MGNRVAQGPYVGLLVPSEIVQHANLRANDGVLGNSDYTQAGPRPGVPEFDQAEVAASSATAGDYGPSLSLDGLGEQDPDTSYHLKALKGGFPGQHATLARRDSLSSGDWRGWNTHNVLVHLERDYLINRDGTGGTNVSYSQVTTADNQAMAVWWEAGQIKVRKYDPETRTASAEVVAVDVAAAINADTSSYERFATTANVLDALKLPSGRLVIYYLTREIDGSSTDAQLWAAYSDDDGASWRTGQYLGLDSPLDVSGGLYKLRAAHAAQGVVLLIEIGWLVDQTPHRGIVQYGSDDSGLNFVEVYNDQTEGSTDNNSHPDVVVAEADGTFVVVWEHDLNNFLRFSRLASPFTPYNEDAQTMASSVSPDHVVAYADPGGWLYTTYDTADGVELYYSRDGGVTWAVVEPVLNHNESTNTFVWDITVAKGRAVWIIGQTASAGGALPLTDHKMFWMEAGGWNTLCQPRVLGTDPTVNRGFGSVTGPESGTWFPSDKPEDSGFALTGTTKTPSATVPLGLQLTTNSSVYSVVPAGAKTDGIECFFGLEVASGGSLTNLDVGLHVILDTLDVELRFSTTQVRLWDNHAGAAVGTASPSGGMSSEHVFKLAVRQDGGGGTKNATLYRRSPSNDVWETLITGTLTAGGSVANSIKWGHHVTTADCTWTFFHWVADTGSGDTGDYFDDLAQDILGDDPFVLYGAPLPAPPFQLYVDQGLFVRGTSGPAYRGDTWRVEPRFDHPVANMDWRNSATPWAGWRSTGVTQALFAWDATLDATLGSTSIGMFLGGINFPDAELLGWNGAAWVTLATLNGKLGPGLPCTVTGDTVTVNTGSASSNRYIGYGEYVGGYVKFSGGDIRKIVWNSEGVWTDGATKRPVFRFEGGAPGGATATCELWYPSAVVLLHENTTIYDRYALNIPAQSTYEGYFTVGVPLIGHVVFFGWKNARGRVIETEPNYAMRQDQAGRRAVRKLGRARRAVVMAWSDRDLTEISGDSPSPDYISLRPGTPEVADRHSAALVLEGLLGELGGATRPVVYLPKIPETTVSDKVTELASREDHVYGRIVQGVTRSSTMGTELVSEVVSAGGFRLEEEV